MSPSSRLPVAFPRSVHARALGTFTILTALLLLAFLRYSDVDVWQHLQASRELQQPAYSETVHAHSIFRTRANTWSNLAFVLVGLYALAAAIHDRRQAIGWLRDRRGTPPALTVLFGVACCYLGLGSGIFHASLTRWGQQLDVASMYPPMLALLTIMVHRNIVARLASRENRGAAVVTALLIVAVAVSAILLYVYKWSMSSKTVLPLHVLALAIAYGADYILHTPRGRLRWLAASFLALVLGVTCRQLDVAGNFSGPDAWYQGHALWHILCALSLYCGWYYLRGDDPATT